jgi:hypothetical protein
MVSYTLKSLQTKLSPEAHLAEGQFLYEGPILNKEESSDVPSRKKKDKI